MVVFRTDANSETGAGHVMRDLAIADAFIKKGEEAVFVMAGHDMEEKVRSHGIAVKILDSDYRDMESEDCRAILEEFHPAHFFVDSYQATEKYLEELHRLCAGTGCSLIVMDDLAKAALPCDVLVNYNIFADEKVYLELYKGKQLPLFMLGTGYAPLRPEFSGGAAEAVRRFGRNILISTGGADAEHLTLSLLKYAADTPYEYDIVVGALNGDAEEIERAAAGHENIHIRRNIESMSALMREADVAISAAGSTLYELCSMGVPTVTYVLADNQMAAAECFAEKKIMKYAGDIRDMGTERLAEELTDLAGALLDDHEERARAAAMMRGVTDGRGARRIAGEV